MDINETIKREIEGTGSEDSPLKININGNELSFSSVEDLNANLTQALSTVGAEYKQMKDRLAELEAQANMGQTVQGEEEIVDTGKFSQEKFISLLKDNPVEAFDYVDSYRYGVEKPAEYIKQNLKQSQETREVYEVNRWLEKHPEFPGGNYGPLLDKIRVQLNLPLTAQNLELAYQNGIQAGVIPDFKTMAVLNYQRQQILQEIQNNGGVIPPSMTQGQNNQNFQTSYPNTNWQNDFGGKPANPAPPPRLPGGGNQNINYSEADLDTLTTEQVERILAKHGMLK